MSLDSKDKHILNILQNDSTLSVKEISERIGLTFTPTYERIKNLEKSGIIQKYVALLNRKKLNLNVVAYCNVTLKNQTKEHLLAFENEIFTHNEIQEVISLSGGYDYMLKIIVKDIDDYNNFIVNTLSNIQNINQYHSSIVLNEIKNVTTFKLLE